MSYADIDATLLLALKALLEVHNVTRAATHLGITQPALSGRLARLRVKHSVRAALGFHRAVRVVGGLATGWHPCAGYSGCQGLGWSSNAASLRGANGCMDHLVVHCGRERVQR